MTDRSNARPRLLFVCMHESSFVRTDLELLPEQYDVLKFSGHGVDLSNPLRLVAFLLRQAIWLLRHAPTADVIYGWFADYHMVLPVLAARVFRKPSAVVLAGFDSNHLPEIGYGVYASPWRAPAAKYVLRNCSLLLPLTRTLIHSENTYTTWPRQAEHGIEAHAGKEHAPFRAIGTGYDPERWPMGPAERPPSVVTVAFIDSLRTAQVKGLDVFAEAARLLPEVPFSVVGVLPEMVYSLSSSLTLPPNVSLLPPAGASELVSIYGTTSVYAQLSRTEGVPSVLCEAMLCGCVPVGSRVFGVQEIIGDTGPLLDSPEPNVVAAAIRSALEAGSEARRRARQRIIENYHIDRRRQALFEALREMHARTAR
ncbi:MAG TPA: glycosyltransferase family 4 protein [Rhodothermales bacterium]